MNISTSTNSTAKVLVPGTPTGTTAKTQSKEAVLSDKAPESGGDSAKSLQDKIELSTEAFRLSQTLKSRDQKNQAEAETTTEALNDLDESKKKEAEQAEPVVEKESTWQIQRNARLDRLQTMVQQGLYKVDPFMLDVIAIRMARLVG